MNYCELVDVWILALLVYIVSLLKPDDLVWALISMFAWLAVTIVTLIGFGDWFKGWRSGKKRENRLEV